MTAITSFSTFHQWLLAESTAVAPACAIIIHTDSRLTGECLIAEVAEYLNEYDDEGDGCWLPATHELVARVSADANYRQLLGIPENSPEGPEGIVETLTALGKRGRVVFHAPETSDPELDQIKTFHAGVGQISTAFAKCHLTLNPDLIDPKSIAHIIGDVFLEWLHWDFRRGTALHQIE
ncbi:MAG: hypothetical protein ABI600_01760 [Luteolibacter sp.]